MKLKSSSSVNQELAFLIGVKSSRVSREEACESLSELKNLARTSGAKVVGETFQDVAHGVSSTFLGKGKISEVECKAQELQANVILVDYELTPAQQKNLEEALKIKVVDRTGLILDIFAKHAVTKEGKMQVALAQSMYLLPRLTGMWEHFSRQRGGIGTQGPGETQLEVDRRRVREKIIHIKKELNKVRNTRYLHRSKRESVPIPMISFVGYTNSGKSTLLNLLTQAGVLVEDQLFATLDPRIKRCRLPSGREVLFADTVGFIKRLPHELVESFKATFEEISRSTLLLHLIDVSNPAWRAQAKTVRKVLKEMNLHRKKTLNVYNKIDLAPHFKAHRGVLISALKNRAIGDLLGAIEDKLSSREKRVVFILPYDKSHLLNIVYRYGRVLKREDREEGVYILATLSRKFRKIVSASTNTQVRSKI